MTEPDRRRRELRLPASTDRRRGDRRAGQAAVIDHRRATDHRLDAAGAALLLQRSAFIRQAQEPVRVPVPMPVAHDRVVDLDAPRPGSPRSASARLASVEPAPPTVVPPGSAPVAAFDVVDLPPDACTDTVACPLCNVLFDPLWLFQHVAVDH